jgi:ABC-type glycerol-3-phosphate transport system substrate-binding protein
MFLFDLFGRSFLMSAMAGATVMAVGGMAYTAANTVPTTVAGSGSGSVSGYTISSIVYNVNASNPNNVDSVTFTYSPSTPDPTRARISGDGGTTWFNCDSTIVGGSDQVIACLTSGLTVPTLASLTIVLTT